MRIINQLLNNKVGRRIAILLFIAAFTPTMLMTILSNQKVESIISNYEHKLLNEKARNYGLATFSNLLFARSNLINFATNAANTKSSSISQLIDQQQSTFKSIYEVNAKGVVLNTFGSKKETLSAVTLTRLDTIPPNKTVLHVLTERNKPPKIYLIYHSAQHAPLNSFFIAELETSFLWASNDEYPTELDVCVFQINNDSKAKLFCSVEKIEQNNNENTLAINNGSRELFLKAEFDASPWDIEVRRQNPITQSYLREFIGSSAYISIAVLSFLIVGLLSLIQIRKTMVPLEQLMSGTKKIAAGEFNPIQVSGNSEFSELANAFNGMSSHIKQQLETLKSFSSIDKEIISNINIEEIIKLVLARMQQLEPNNLFCIAHMAESSWNEAQCNCFVSGHAALTTTRVIISNQEINGIKRHSQGHTSQCLLDSERIHERFMAELGANYLWVLPIFWQGTMVAFLLVGSKVTIDSQQTNFAEYQELASRIGIVIAAHEREQKLLFEAQYDSLTGLPNRILLQDRLKVAIEHSDRTNNPIWIVFIDLDRFKVVNDSLGHNAGDALLKEIGQRLQAEVRESDTVARFGGDEFIVILSDNVSENVKLNMLNRLMRTIAFPVYISNQEVINTCSVGISIYPDDAKTTDHLIKNADIAMYRAKELGRNNYQFFTQSLNSKAAERMQIITLLRQALEKNELSLHYQPKVDLSTNQIVGLEALIRWNNALLGNVSPAKFIPIAEDAGLIVPIGEWVFKTACKQLAIWQKMEFGPLLLSINISARQFNQANLIKNIKSQIIEHEIKAGGLELELTESLLMDNSPELMSALHAIKALDVQLSIDDFGTGYSNLAYLNTLPIDTLKIDKAFIDNIVNPLNEAPIVNTIINLAKNLKLKVIAEGVETANQVQYLKSHGCDQIQGYYFSKPLPADGISQMLLSNKTLDLSE
jgi:diguanylate cyclase (GGDEF)-like protein